MTRRTRLKWFVVIASLAVVAIGTTVFVYLAPNFLLQPVRTFGSPLRMGDRVYLLTGQWKTRIAFDDSSVRDTDLLVDLWAFDANTAKPMWRRRLQTEHNGAMDGRAILGSEGNTVWLLLPGGPAAASLSDGAIVADSARIEARNPELKGLMPKESRYVHFDAQGLKITAADARVWRLDPENFSATPEGASTTRAEGIMPAYFAARSTSTYQERGLSVPPDRWLGLLNEKEVEYFRTNNTIGGMDSESRRRLWAARTGEGKNFFGKYTTYSDFTPLGADFLAPGLLSHRDPDYRSQVLWLRNPDSVLILYRDRLGEEGRLRLARVAGPAGRVIWDTALPLSVLQSVMRGEKSVVLYGRLFTPHKDNRPRDPMHDAREILIGLDLATGRIGVHDHSDTKQHIDAVSGEVER